MRIGPEVLHDRTFNDYVHNRRMQKRRGLLGQHQEEVVGQGQLEHLYLRQWKRRKSLRRQGRQIARMCMLRHIKPLPFHALGEEGLP